MTRKVRTENMGADSLIFDPDAVTLSFVSGGSTTTIGGAGPTGPTGPTGARGPTGPTGAAPAPIVSTVAGLGSAASNAGVRAVVTDGSTDPAANFAKAVTGGGSYKGPVYSDGTGWFWG